MKKKLKKPSDYAQFYFRIDEQEKTLLENRIQSILKIEILEKSETDYLPKRNDLILKALKKGLSDLERKAGIR